jgi:phenylalanine-4-hydroxylase
MRAFAGVPRTLPRVVDVTNVKLPNQKLGKLSFGARDCATLSEVGATYEATPEIMQGSTQEATSNMITAKDTVCWSLDDMIQFDVKNGKSDGKKTWDTHADVEYLARKKKILALSDTTPIGSPIPLPDYGFEDHITWQRVCKELDIVHQETACSRYLQRRAECPMTTQAIPNVEELRQWVIDSTGLNLYLAPGFIDSKLFFDHLAKGFFPVTLYIRHGSDISYAPEPDIVHEVIGHVPMLGDPEMADFMIAMCKLADGATEDEIAWLSKQYIYTVEFGLVRESGKLKVLGAGLLSSMEEQQLALTNDELFRMEYCPRKAGEYNYAITGMQTHLFVMDDLQSAKKAIHDEFYAIRRI